jgi:hypothetical protein
MVAFGGLNLDSAVSQMVPFLVQQYSEQLVPIRGSGEIYPAFLGSEIFKGFFNSLFDGNQRCETALQHLCFNPTRLFAVYRRILQI